MAETLLARRPDSRLARQAEDLVTAVAPSFLTNHSFRSHFFAVALADRDDVRFDTELLYVAALLHDIGLVEEFDTGKCFEEDGADAAARLAGEEGWPEERCEALAEVVRLHVATKIDLADGPEAYLLWHSTGLDVAGHRHAELRPDAVARILEDYPRLDFKEGFTDLVAHQASRKPGCWAARAMESGLRDRIAAAPFES
jgi:predicted HD phosphohydrolase